MRIAAGGIARSVDHESSRGARADFVTRPHFSSRWSSFFSEAQAPRRASATHPRSQLVRACCAACAMSARCALARAEIFFRAMREL
jgi:hypothetical protein